MIVTQICLDRILSEFKSELLSFRPRLVCTIHAMLNAYVYHAGLNDGRISRDREGRKHFGLGNIAEFFRADREINSPITGIKKYVEKHWPGLTYTDRESLTNVRTLISQTFKIFKLEYRTEMWRDPLNRHRKPNPCAGFNMVRAILLARACEEHLLSYCDLELEAVQLDIETAGNGNYEFDRVEDRSLPKHKAYTLALVGKKSGLWTRSDRLHPDLEPIVELESLRVQAEDLLDRVEYGDRSEEQVLEEELLVVTEIETVETESEGSVAIAVDRPAGAIPLAHLVGISMWVPPIPRPLFDSEGGIRLPRWAIEESGKSLRWWQRAIDRAGEWLCEFAPEWVVEILDAT